MRLSGKKVLVTGSSRGIGRAIALQLAKEKAEVIIHYRENIHESENLLEQIRNNGGKAHLLQADLRDCEQATRLGEAAWEMTGGIDILINNAGVSYKKHFLDTSIDDVDHFINVNFKSTLLLTQAIAKKMVANKVAGSIYTITSVNGIQPGAGFSVYGATKGALETLMKGVALELAPHNINVNTLAVGAIQTDINAAVWQDAEKLSSVNNRIPMHRFGQPEEVARVLCDLLSSGTYITGSTIVIDGGWLLNASASK